MAHNEALGTLNEAWDGVAKLVRAIVDAQKSNGISGMEWVGIAAQGLQLSPTVIDLVENLDDEDLDDILHVLEHARLVLPGDSEGAEAEV